MTLEEFAIHARIERITLMADMSTTIAGAIIGHYVATEQYVELINFLCRWYAWHVKIGQQAVDLHNQLLYLNKFQPDI